MENQYYKVKKDRQDYKGERYFMFNPMSEKVIQVCLNGGDEKKGRTNTFGVYLIHRITFLSNYLTYNYAEPCTSSEYEKNFKKVVKMLTTHKKV